MFFKNDNKYSETKKTNNSIQPNSVKAFRQ